MGLSQSDRYIRLKTVHNWIAEGHSHKTLHQLIEERFGLKGYKSRHKLIKDCLREIYAGYDIETIRKTNQERIEAIIGRAMETGQDKLALDAIDKFNKTAGVYTEKHEHSFRGEVIKVKFGE
ncbi:MAG: hypothetical protein LUE93_13360 [Bacteroides sp.]|nr:hypothetical protein [Bacteroides sp.]